MAAAYRVVTEPAGFQKIYSVRKTREAYSLLVMIFLLKSPSAMKIGYARVSIIEQNLAWH
jgi:hypothetical protein